MSIFSKLFRKSESVVPYGAQKPIKHKNPTSYWGQIGKYESKLVSTVDALYNDALEKVFAANDNVEVLNIIKDRKSVV